MAGVVAGVGRRAMPRAQRRIMRTPIYHPGTFQTLVGAAQATADDFPGPGWRLAHAAEGVEIYERADHDAEWFRERVETYEREVYAELMVGVCAADGRIRGRTCTVIRDGAGVYRQQQRAG